ncbi:MAG TPA: fatty acid desaturase, partial [Thermoanaerobaculia bacterium]|nr:fatty acid desaturase [Thermoanaerobaculia bacterium]
NLGHHPHYLEREKDTLRWQRPGGSPRSFVECMVKNFAGHLTLTMTIGRRHPKVYRRFKIMTAVSLVTLSVLIYLDPVKAMIVFAGPMLLAIFNVARLGYDQHAGLELDDHFGASRNIESRLYNLVTFNSGYHTAHHVRPGLHWSRLPEFHRQIRDRIPSELRV